MPRWHPVSISGYHIREAGATAAQELAFTLADGFAYVEACLERGMDIDDFAPRLSFFFNAHIDFFEEIAKYRAARRIWARTLREKYGARNDRSLLMRFHTQTAGVSLTAQQPEVNIVRTALEALSAVLGGTQSLHTNSYDEALALPTEGAARLALRTQQVIAHETGVVHAADPLGGSWLVESLTDRIEAEAHAYFDRIEQLGGVLRGARGELLPARDRRVLLRLPARGRGAAAADRRGQRPRCRGRQPGRDSAHLAGDRAAPGRAAESGPRAPPRGAGAGGAGRALAGRRDGHKRHAGDRRLRPAYASEGEICDALRAVWGVYRETPVF